MFQRVRLSVRCVCVALASGVLFAAAFGGSSARSDAGKSAARKLLVVSVDGLDWRYLRDRNALKLSIPHIRHLLAVSAVADGVTGVWPTVTWPSHTSIVTGARPDQHGILANGRGKLDPALSYWSARKIKAQTLWQCAAAGKRTTAAITWPVTVDADITYNLPEAFSRRSGGSMDLDSVARYATPGLIAEISAAYPSFPQQWVDDRTRTLATVFLLKRKQPDLILLHLVQLDSESHAQGPYGVNARAILERTDELIGQLLAALPPDYDFVLTSDHGFQRIDRDVQLRVMAARDNVAGKFDIHEGVVFTADAGVAAWLRRLEKDPENGIGREIPHTELIRYAPDRADGYAFSPAAHVWFGTNATGPAVTAPARKGRHGYWPLRRDYRSIFLVSGPGIAPARLPTLQMTELKQRMASLMGISCAH